MTVFMISFFGDNEEALMKKKFFALGRDVVKNFFTTKALFLGTPANDQEGKKDTKAKNYNKFKYDFFIFFFTSTL